MCLFAGGGCSGGHETVPTAQKRVGVVDQGTAHQMPDSREEKGEEEERKHKGRISETFKNL